MFKITIAGRKDFIRPESFFAPDHFLLGGQCLLNKMTDPAHAADDKNFILEKNGGQMLGRINILIVVDNLNTAIQQRPKTFDAKDIILDEGVYTLTQYVFLKIDQ